jgi:16S rRNA (cytosine1402-N4)-methyltransferase
MTFNHISVLLDECIEHLNIKEDGIYVDGTLGGAGHSSVICSKLGSNGRLIGIDQDEDAIAYSTEKLKVYKNTVTIVRSNYNNFGDILDDLSVEGVDGILLDLGVSSFQLDTAERGFSYMQDAPLDMRMDQRQSRTAKTIINEYSYHELTKMLKVYGEEKFANNIAKHILIDREVKTIETTFELVDIIRKAIPMKIQKTLGHPGKRTFQAIRIELNEELTVLQNTLQTMIDRLNPGGKLCIITFHSLEDRIVKQMFRHNENPCTCPSEFPVCICGKLPTGKAIPKKPILPTEKEMEENSRSKSAKLRVFKKNGGDDHEQKISKKY